MNCCICRKGLDQVGVLHRINAKGQPGIWVCTGDRSKTDAPVDPELDQLVNVIAGRP